VALGLQPGASSKSVHVEPANHSDVAAAEGVSDRTHVGGEPDQLEIETEGDGDGGFVDFVAGEAGCGAACAKRDVGILVCFGGIDAVSVAVVLRDELGAGVNDDVVASLEGSCTSVLADTHDDGGARRAKRRNRPLALGERRRRGLERNFLLEECLRDANELDVLLSVRGVRVVQAGESKSIWVVNVSHFQFLSFLFVFLEAIEWTLDSARTPTGGFAAARRNTPLTYRFQTCPR